jgi:hypothetical protein
VLYTSFIESKQLAKAEGEQKTGFANMVSRWVVNGGTGEWALDRETLVSRQPMPEFRFRVPVEVRHDFDINQKGVVMSAAQCIKFEAPILISFPTLNEGEKWVGVVISADGTKREHIILLPGDNEDASWKAQMDWAASIGGELPDRTESALLFATMKDEFKPEWYWTREQHAASAGCAWCQYFYDGSQHYDNKSAALRARAVRRLIIQ